MILTILKFVLNWLTLSSKNSEKVSATAVGGIGFAILSMMAGGIDVPALTDDIDNLVLAIGQLVTAGYAIWGLGRKIYRTFMSENAVINDKLVQ